MGEVLHEVDFNQLKIENQQYLEKIDEKNQDLLRLKLMDGNVQQILNTYKVSRDTGKAQKRVCKSWHNENVSICTVTYSKILYFLMYIFWQKKLHTLTMESSRLKMEIGQRNELLYKIDAETQMVEKVSLLCLEK